MSESEAEEGSMSLDDLAYELRALKEEQKQQRVVVLPKERTITKFTGDARQLTVADFREQVEAAWGAQAITKKEDRIQFLLSHVSTAVREELACHPPADRTTPEKILFILEEVYGDKRSVCQLLVAFNSIHQRQGETVRAYSSRMNRAFQELKEKQKKDGQEPMSDKVLRDQFIAQLHDDLLVRQLREKAFQDADLSFYAAREAAIRWRADEEERPTVPVQTAAATTTSSGEMSILVKELQTLKDELAAMKDQMARQHHRTTGPTPPRSKWEFTADGKPICFRCKTAGHIGRNCPRRSGNGAPLL